MNDPLYNHEAWGEERFQSGPCTKNVFDVVLAISRTYEHDPYVMLNPSETPQNETAAKSNKDSQIVNKTVDSSSSDTEPTESNTPHFSPTCPECRNPLPDPVMKWMVMYLHAYKYKGSDWEFLTDLPPWANHESLNNLLNMETDKTFGQKQL